jgi:glycosyltransferase involved in cell wall biosynthesis
MAVAAPLVSVVIPTYHRPRVLDCAIRSVLDQTLGDLELLVVGDGCTDGTAELVQGYEDERVRWENLPANTGCQGAPNQRGLELARGRYVAYLLHDDVWHPRHLELVVGAMQRRRADLGHSVVVQVGPDDISGVRSLARAVRPLLPTGIVHARETGLRAGGWRHRRVSGELPDIDFTYRVRAAATRVVAVRRVTAFAFVAWSRPGVYATDPCHEQEECLRRMREDRLLVPLAVARGVRGRIRRRLAR